MSLVVIYYAQNVQNFSISGEKIKKFSTLPCKCYLMYLLEYYSYYFLYYSWRTARNTKHTSFYLKEERGKAGVHKPQHFPLPCHILAFFCLPAAISHNRKVFHATTFDHSGSYYVFKMINLAHWNCDFQKFSCITRKIIYLYTLLVCTLSAC